MKKAIWIILPIVIVAIVLVAVFVSQRNALSDQLTQLQAERSELTRQLNEADMAAKTAQELAETNQHDRDDHDGQNNPNRFFHGCISPSKYRFL